MSNKIMYPSINYAKLVELIETLDPSEPNCRFHVQNLRAVILLVPNLTVIQQQDLNVRLLRVGRMILAAHRG